MRIDIVSQYSHEEQKTSWVASLKNTTTVRIINSWSLDDLMDVIKAHIQDVAEQDKKDAA